MSIRTIKDWINSLPEEELDKELHYHMDDYSLSGIVTKVVRCKEIHYAKLYDSHPILLYTRRDIEDSMPELSQEEIDEEIKLSYKVWYNIGDYYIDI